MNVSLRMPRMTREQFLDWIERQEKAYEFDGNDPIAMTGGNRQHSRLCHNLNLALGNRLLGTSLEVLPEAGIAIGENAVRFPDLLITATAGPSTAQLMPNPLVVFEVVSPTSRRIDHVIKLREYQKLQSLQRYVVVESEGPDLIVFARTGDMESWTAVGLTSGDTLQLPELGVDVPVDEIYRGIVFE